MKIAIATLGCKANQYDSACMEESARLGGLDIVHPLQEADVYVVNTCTVTQRADVQGRQMLRRLRREHGDSMIIATGCYAQADPDALAGIPGIDAVLGLRERGALGDILSELLGGGDGRRPMVRVGPQPGVTFFGPAALSSRTRAFFKIQDGCDYRCSFCIVPRVRGRSRSLTPDKVLQGISAYRERGIAEVVLSGIHLGAYGHDLTPRVRLLDLLSLLRNAGQGKEGMRIRLSSLDPHEVSPELMDLISGTPSLCRHLHISLQSGDRDVLGAMNRPGPQPENFTDAVLTAKKAIPGLCIGVDVVAGFPAETPVAFENTRNLLESLPVSYLHVFPYSRRKGTPAADMPHQVPPAEIARRAGRLRALGKRKRLEFYRGFLGKGVSVLTERSRDRRTGALTGFTDNYIRVLFEGPDDLMEKEVPVKLARIDNGRVRGEGIFSLSPSGQGPLPPWADCKGSPG